MPSRRLTVPIPSPPSEYCAIPSRSALFPAGSQEATKLEAVLDHFSDEKLQILEKDKGTEKRGLDDVEKMFLSEEMMLRYLKEAARWNVANTIKRLEATLVWRRILGLYDVEANAKELEPEFESGKIAIIGYTRLAQPILYTWTAKNVNPASFRQVKHIMFCMERTIDLQLAGVPGVMFCADVSGKTQTHSGAMGVSRQILNYFKAHYPERLGGAGLLKMPWLGSIFVTLLWPFVDPDTRRKIHLNPELSTDLVAPDQLLDMYGGDIEFEWSDEFLPGLVKLCVKRRADNLRRWREKGGRVGLSEWEFMERVGGELSEWDFMKRVGGENGTGSGTEVTAAARTSAGPPSFAAEKITGVNGSSASPIPPAET